MGDRDIMTTSPRIGIIGRGPWATKIVETIRRECMAEISWIGGVGWRIIETVAPPVEAVIVASAAESHESILLELLARRPAPAIFVEKPVVVGLDATKRINEAWIKAGCPVILVDHLYLFHPAFVELRRLVSATTKVVSIGTVFGDDAKVHEGQSRLWDWGPHAASTCLALVDAAAASGSRWQVTREPARAVSVRMPDAAYRFDAESGILWAGTMSIIKVLDSTPPLTAALRHFFKAVDGDPASRLDYRMGMDLPLRVADAIATRAMGEAVSDAVVSEHAR